MILEQQFQQEVEENKEDRAYQQSLDSRGYDSEELEKRDAADKEEALLNLIFKIAEHPNGEFHAKNLISNFYKEEGDFRDGGVFDGVDVANLLNPLRTVFPDIYNIAEGDEGPRPVSLVADKFKKFMEDEWNRREHPVETFAPSSINPSTIFPSV